MDSKAILAQARELTSHLVATNLKRVPPERRVRLLEDAGSRIAQSHADLSTVYASAPQPLESEARDALALACELSLACAWSYRIAASDTTGARPSQPEDSLPLGPLFFQAMRHLGMIMDASYKAYARLPAGTWTAMHEVYLFAEREGVAFGAADRATRLSVHDLYAEYLLLSLANPYRLVPGEYDRVQSLVRELRAPITVGREHPQTRSTCHFVVPGDKDQPPHPRRESAPGKRSSAARVLDTSPVVDALKHMPVAAKRLRECEERESLARRLVALWDDPPARMMRREDAEGSVAICVGVNPIASFVAHETGVDAEAESQALRQGLTMPLQALPEDESGHLIPIHEWAVINVSTSGLKVRRKASTAYPVTVGEIVGVRSPGRAMWKVGVTRWVTGMHDGATEFGVQFFAQAVCAVWAKKASADNPPRVLALLVAEGEEHSAELLLATPGTYESGADYELRGEGFRSRVRAGKLVESTSRFELFEVTPS